MKGGETGEEGKEGHVCAAWRVGGWKCKQNVQGRPSLRGDFGGKP